MSAVGRSGDPAERLGRALVELTRRPEVRTAEPPALLDQVQVGRLVDLACHHRVPGVVYRSLSELGMDGAEFAGLRAAYQMATLSHARCLLELETVADVLGKLRHPWMVVKGPVLAEVGYGDPGARLYEDLDMVVAAADLSAALDGIEAAGGRVTDLNWPMMVDLMRAEIPMALPAGMLGDLHWHVSVTPSIRSRFTISMDELFERRRSVRLGGTDVATLDTVDGILYLCLHGSTSGGDQLVWLKDLDQMIVSEAVDWDELARRADRYRVGLVAGMQLERARVVLGAPVPESVPVALARNEVWLRWWRTRERKIGMARWGGDDHNDSRLVSATSGDTWSSAVELARIVASDMAVHYLGRTGRLGRLGHFGHRNASRRDGSEGNGPDEEVPELYRPAGAVDARAVYMDLVESGRWS